MKGNRMQDALESIARRGVPENINLWPKIAVALAPKETGERNERKSLMFTLRTRPLAVVLLALIVVLALSGAAYAIGRSLGYVPGVGLVNQSASVRVLAEPVVAQRDDLTVTVSRVVADSDHTFVAYAIDGLFWQKEGWPRCNELPSLQLPDGSALNVVSGGDGPRGGRVGDPLNFETTVFYPPVPADVSDIKFTFPCILAKSNGTKDWQIPLKLSPAPKDYATPGVEIGATFISSYPSLPVNPTPTWDPRVTPEPTDPSAPPMPTPAPRSGLYLERVIELPDSYVLIGNFTDSGDLPGPVEFNLDPNADLPHIEDGLGNPVTFKVREDLQPGMGWGVRYWAYEVAKPVRGPLKITLDQVSIAATDKSQFTFDVGPDPQAGQKWEINLPIRLRGYDYVVDAVEAVKGGYVFKYHSGNDAPEGVGLLIGIVNVSLEQQNNMQVSSMLVNQGAKVVYSDTIIYPAPLPVGALTVELSLTESVPLQGPWTLTWSPPPAAP
jgi:hypothetical protein